MKSGNEMAEARGKIGWMKNSNSLIIFSCKLPSLAPKALAKMIAIRI